MKILKTSFFFFTLFLSCNNTYSQSRPLPVESYKYKTVRHILEKIAATFSDSKPVPHLVMYGGRTSNRVAQFSNVPAAQIAFDEKLYDLCMAMGPDSLKAIAFIVGHELTHYYFKHEEWAGFAQMLAHAQIAPEKVKQAQELEMVADKQGFFKAFAAGYECFGVTTALYEKIYQEYKFPDDLDGYPSKTERIRKAGDESATVQRFATIFEIGKLFFLTGKYHEATQCFGHVASQFPSKELFLNLGVAELKEAVKYVRIAEMPFALPFELENANRLQSASRTENITAMGNHLKNAEKYLRNAIGIDPAYLKAYINLAICQLLMKKPGTAVDTLQEAHDVAGWSENAQLTQAIAKLFNGDQKEAFRLLVQIKEGYQKAYNDAVFQKFGQSIARKMLPDEVEAGLLYKQYFNSMAVKAIGRVNWPSKLPEVRESFVLPGFATTLTAQVRPDGNAIIYTIVASGSRFCDFYVGESGGSPPAGLPIELNDTPASITSKLGISPDRILFDEQKAYLVYQSVGMILQVENEKIVRYISYEDYTH